MKKRDLKSNPIAKKSINTKRKGNSNFRAINNYQIDKVPNDNLYKNDNFYSINKHFEFPHNEENSFKLFHYHHFIKDSFKEFLSLLYLRFFSLRINTFSELFSFSNIFNIKNSIHLVSVVISYFLIGENILKNDKFKLFLYYLFSFNQGIHVFSLYYKVNFIPAEYYGIISEMIFNLVFIFFLRKKVINTFVPLFIIICIYLYTSKIVIGLDILFYICFGLLSSTVFFMVIVKSIKEVWALYDSFKRSYFNLNQGLLDSDPNPIFIISKDKNLLYKNTAASKLATNILENPNPASPRKIQRNKEDRLNSINFLDLVHPNLRDLFKKLLNDIMTDENGGTFNFPLCKINNNQNLDVNITNAYDINNEKNYLYYAWYNILVCKTEWKNKTSFYMCLFPSDDIHVNEIYYQYTKRFSEKIEKVITGSDIISMAILYKMENKNNPFQTSNATKSDKEEEEEEEEDKQDETEENKKNDLEPQKKNIYKLLVDNANNLELNNTILFFFKNQVELLYDYSLTLELYFTTLYKQRNFKYCYEKNKPNLKNRIKLKDLQEYYSEYFYDFTKEHKYKLEFKNDEEYIYDIYIEENYLRIIVFNIIVFLISYLDDKTEPSIENRKEIIIKLIPEPGEETSPQSQESNNNSNEDKYDGKNLIKGKLSLIFESFSLKADLNKIQELINQRNKNNCHIKAEILKLNYFDIGILTTKYLLENYYKTKLEMLNKEGEQIIQIKIPCDLELLIDSAMAQNSLNNTNLTSSSFFTSPKLKSRGNIKINKPKNFYNYNQNYNKKVLDIFYGIEKSPLMGPRHMRAVPSLGEINLKKNKERRFLRLVTHNYNDSKSPAFNKFKENLITDKEDTKVNYIDNSISPIKEKGNNDVEQNKKNYISQFSFKKIEFLDPNISSLKNDKIKQENENTTLEESKSKEIIEEEKNEINVLIFETQKNKEFISLLNNEKKGNYILKIKKSVEEVEKELKENKGKCIYKILLINMGNIKEIKYAENVCDKKGESLIFGYHFGIHTKSREKNNVKFDKRFDLSFSYEGILYALNQVVINNSSIINN